MRRRQRGSRPLRWGAAAAAAALQALVALACGPPAPRHPDIVLVVVDTLRADHLGAYGAARGASPRIDALARGGTVFEDATAAAPWTLPSIMSIMTSRHASSHRVENDGLRLDAAIPTLAETLLGAGYATGAFVAHVYVGAPFGFDRGFVTFEDFGVSRPGYRLEAGMEPPADRVTAAALEWVRGQGRAPIFLFVHYFDPHWPYAPPPTCGDRFASDYQGPLDATYDSISKFQDPLVPLPEDYRAFLLDRYDGEIACVDAQIGELVDGVARERRGRPWVLVTADHGEEFKDHGSMGHGRQLYQETIRVPLVVARADRPSRGGAAPGATDGPAAPPPGGAAGTIGRRVTEPVGGIDLFPTIVALAGAAAPPGLQGKSLAPLLDDAAATNRAAAGAPSAGAAADAPASRLLVSETVRLNAYRKAVRNGALKLIHAYGDSAEGHDELYDLAADPGEKRDLAAARPDEARRLAGLLFSEVDLLSGGWNVRWSGDGKAHRFQGRLRTSGIFRTIVPLAPRDTRYAVQGGNTLTFTVEPGAAPGGLAFTIAPYASQVEFYLTIDGRAQPARVFLGGRRALPRALPFTMDGEAPEGPAFERPEYREGKDLGYFLWRIRPTGGEAVVLDDDTRARLRSLGYVQ